jgi:hypothetical protein
VSALVGLLAVLAFGTLYGILGVLVAIPLTAVMQVLLDIMVFNVEPASEPAGLVGSPWEELRVRVRALRRHARTRLRGRTSRMGIDPATPDHVVDDVDQQIEVAVGRVETLMSAAEEASEPLGSEALAEIVGKLQGAMERIEQAVGRVGMVALGTSSRTAGLAQAEPPEATGQGEQSVEQRATVIATTAEAPEALVDNLDQATQRFKEAVQDVATLVVAAKEESRDAQTRPVVHPEQD